jgi:hypothetical protein
LNKSEPAAQRFERIGCGITVCHMQLIRRLCAAASVQSLCAGSSAAGKVLRALRRAPGSTPTLCCTYSFMTAMAYRWGADTAAGNMATGIGAHLRSATRRVTSYATMAPRQVPKIAYGLSCSCRFGAFRRCWSRHCAFEQTGEHACLVLCIFKWVQPRCQHTHSTVL